MTLLIFLLSYTVERFPTNFVVLYIIYFRLVWVGVTFFQIDSSGTICNMVIIFIIGYLENREP